MHNIERRRAQIFDLVKQQGSLSVRELIDMVDASPSTVRRDISEMENKKMLSRTHGYVHIPDPERTVFSLREGTLDERSLVATEEKKNIAIKAADFVKDGMTLLLDSGSTALELAKVLRNRPITILTNSMEICQELSFDNTCKVICCGGMLEQRDRCFLGRDSIRFVEKTEVDIAFLGVSGVRGSEGLTTSSPLQFDYKRAILSAARRSYAIFDSTKFNSANLYVFARFEDLTGIITNPVPEESAPGIILNQLKDRGIAIHFSY